MRYARTLALLAALPMWTLGAQRANVGRIVGSVRDVQTGRPLPNARVVLSAPDDSVVLRSVETDAAGKFSLDGVAPARYRIRALHARLDQFDLPSLDYIVQVRRGALVRATLGSPTYKPVSEADGCGESLTAHPGSIEMTGATTAVSGGAAQAAALRGPDGIKAQYSLVEGCRKAPLSEKK